MNYREKLKIAFRWNCRSVILKGVVKDWLILSADSIFMLICGVVGLLMLPFYPLYQIVKLLISPFFICINGDQNKFENCKKQLETMNPVRKRLLASIITFVMLFLAFLFAPLYTSEPNQWTLFSLMLFSILWMQIESDGEDNDE